MRSVIGTTVCAAALLFTAATAAGCAAISGPLSPGGAGNGAAGAYAERLDRIEEVLQAEVAAGRRAGFVAMVATGDGVAYATAVGEADREAALPMAIETRFRIASMTKPIVSAAAMRLIEEGRLALNDPIERLVPAFADPVVALDQSRRAGAGGYRTRPASRGITVRDLLTHTAGIGYAFLSATDLDRDYVSVNPFFTEGSLAERVNAIAGLPLYSDPGERWFYSYATDVLGRIVEVASGQSLDAYLQETFFQPLGMDDTFFLMDPADTPSLARVYTFDENGAMRLPGPVDPTGTGHIADINSDAFGVLSGGAGLVSTAPDYIRFCRMLLNGGELDGARVLSSATVRAMTVNSTPAGALPEDWRARGLGFGLGGQVVMEAGQTGEFDAPGDWRWGGYWGTSFVVNLEDNIAIVLLAQREPGPNDPGTNAFELIKAIAYASLSSD